MENLNISTQRLLVRSLKHSDLHDFHSYRSDPEVTKYQGFDVFTLEQAKQFLQNNSEKLFGIEGEWIQYGIEKKDTGQLIGDCAVRLSQNDPRIAEIGITISQQEQKKGFGKEVLIEWLRFLFDKKNMHRVVETVDAENIASINLLKSTGFRLEGHFVENIFFKGKWGSEFQFAMLKREWDSRK